MSLMKAKGGIEAVVMTVLLGVYACSQTSVKELNGKLYDSFKSEVKDMPQATSSGELYPGYVFPAYYGGSYKESNRLVVLIKGNSLYGKIDIYRRTGYAPSILFKSCEYSFRELVDLRERLGILYRNEDLRKELGWTSVGLLPIDNRVVAHLEDCSEESIARFKRKVSDSAMIVFEALIVEEWNEQDSV